MRWLPATPARHRRCRLLGRSRNRRRERTCWWCRSGRLRCRSPRRRTRQRRRPGSLAGELSCRQVASTWNTRPRLALQPLHFLLRSRLAGRLAKPRTSFLPPKKWAATLPLVRNGSDHRTAYSLRHDAVADGRIQEPHSTCFSLQTPCGNRSFGGCGSYRAHGVLARRARRCATRWTTGTEGARDTFERFFSSSVPSPTQDLPHRLDGAPTPRRHHRVDHPHRPHPHHHIGRRAVLPPTRRPPPKRLCRPTTILTPRHFTGRSAVIDI